METPPEQDPPTAPVTKQGTTPALDWFSIVFETIDLRSFSNLWFWIGLAVLWSSASHWVIGVPYDMVTRARRKEGQAAQDLLDMLRITSGRLLYIAEEAGLWIIAVGMFFLTGCVLLGFVYQLEFAQALFLLGFPMTLISLLSVRTARKLHKDDMTLEEVFALLARHRLIIQCIGMVSIFVTAMWGMYQNLNIGILGG